MSEMKDPNESLQVNTVVLSDAVQKAIEDFMNEPIGPSKIRKKVEVELVLKQDRIKNNKNNQEDLYRREGVFDIWFRIWQKDRLWIDNYLTELEKLAAATSNRLTLRILLTLVPYGSGSEYKDRIDRLDSIITEKKSNKKKRF